VPEPLFEFFERIALELSGADSKVITHEDFRVNKENSPLLDDLMKSLKAPNTEDVIRCAVEKLKEHFEAKGANLPFGYESATGLFTAKDSEFLSFVIEMKDMRSIGKRSRDFECRVAKRLALRATGTLHRVGHPRDRKKKKKQFNRYLRKLGFDQPVLLGREKDGGLDILWMLPVGTIPHRPIVSVQCKNGEFDLKEAYASVGTGSSSLARHSGLQPQVQVPCVLFNDYIYPEMLNPKPMSFVPLGLSDVASLEAKISVELI
jgi:hypothetical protein